MRSPIGSLAPSSRLHNQPALRFISRHLKLWLVLLILGAAVVLSSILAGAHNENLSSAAAAGKRGVQKQGAKSLEGAVNQRGLNFGRNGKPDLSSADRERLEAELFVSPPPLATTQMTNSSAALVQTPNNGNGQTRPSGTQEGNLQSNEQTAQSRGQVERISPKPREERLTRAHPFNGDLRDLPYSKPVRRERRELEGPQQNPTIYPGSPVSTGIPEAATPVAPSAPAPAPLNVFEGLDRFNWGVGSHFP